MIKINKNILPVPVDIFNDVHCIQVTTMQNIKNLNYLYILVHGETEASNDDILITSKLCLSTGATSTPDKNEDREIKTAFFKEKKEGNKTKTNDQETDLLDLLINIPTKDIVYALKKELRKQSPCNKKQVIKEMAIEMTKELAFQDEIELVDQDGKIFKILSTKETNNKTQICIASNNNE